MAKIRMADEFRHIPRCTKPRNSVSWGSVIVLAGAILAYMILPALIFGPQP